MFDTDRPTEVYGRILESAYAAAHSFERVCSFLEWILQEDRWRKVGHDFDDINAFIDSIKLDTLRVSAEQRKRIGKLIKDLQPDASNRKIAKALGTSHVTINRDLGTNVPPEDGKAQENQSGTGTNVPPQTTPPPATLSGAAAARLAIANHRGTAGCNDEFRTPADVVARVRAVLGEIDVDPASTEQANATVKAAKYYTKEDSGLTKPWHGHVFMNPPYSRPGIDEFVAKLIAERNEGHITDAIVLVGNNTDTAWFHDLMVAADAACFTRGRLPFLRPDGAIGGGAQGSCLFYFGKRVGVFAHEFSAIGTVLPTRFGAAADPAGR
jgi:phage N-6-adenine-methyltransferase